MHGGATPRDSTFRLALLTLFLLCSGCSGDESQKLDQSAKALTSWRQSLRVAALQWSAGSVPALYLRQLLHAAAQALDEQEQTLSSADDAAKDSTNAASLRQQLQELRQWHYELSHAVERDDKDAARWLASALAVNSEAATDADGGPPR